MSGTALSLHLRMQNLGHTLGSVTHNVHFMFRPLNDWKNEVNPNTCNDKLLDVRGAAVDIVRNAAWIGYDGYKSDSDFSLLLVVFLEIVLL